MDSYSFFLQGIFDSRRIQRILWYVKTKLIFKEENLWVHLVKWLWEQSQVLLLLV